MRYAHFDGYRSTVKVFDEKLGQFAVKVEKWGENAEEQKSRIDTFYCVYTAF
jgi:hypothetical protein